MITVERLVERLDDAVAAAEQREIELRAIRDELRRQADATERLADAAEELVVAWAWLADLTQTKTTGGPP